MILRSEREAELTRQKIAGLEEQFARASAEPAVNVYVQELTLRSLRRTINQMKEDIIRFESRITSDDISASRAP